MNKPLIGTGAAARKLGVTVKTIHRWVEGGTLAAAVTTADRVRLFDPAEVERLRRERGAARNGKP
jgi:DNA-binding transcriptional MerR regulator